MELETTNNMALYIKPLAIVIFGISLASIHTGLSIVAVCLAIGYTARKWHLMEKANKEKKNNTEDTVTKK